MAEVTEKKYSILEWVFYIVILPLLFTVVLAGVFMSFLGYDIAGAIRNTVASVPVIGSYLPEEQQQEIEITIQSQLEQLQDEMLALEDQINNKKLEIEELNLSLEERNSFITKLEQEVEELKKQLEGKMLDQKTWEENIAELAQLYTAMPPNRAAPIISNLSDIEAIHILNGMTSNNRAKILEKMNPTKAATLTSLLTARPDSETEEIAVLLAKIEQLNMQLDDKNKREEKAKELANLYSNIADDRTAEIISQMSDNEAADILKQMSLAKRTTILEKVPSNRAAQISQLLLK
jgi:flagellar motility protein MotE (MotC chaperone)